LSVGIFVEGPSDRTILRRVCAACGFDLPVRAGHGHYQGHRVLKEWRKLVSLVSEQKLIFVFDADKEPDVLKLLADKPAPIPNRTVVFLVAPWGGIEDFTEKRLDDTARDDYEQQRAQGVSKRILAELFAPRITRNRLLEDDWIANTLVSCLKCQCPPQRTVA
jgi:hypothetical protein